MSVKSSLSIDLKLEAKKDIGFLMRFKIFFSLEIMLRTFHFYL